VSEAGEKSEGTNVTCSFGAQASFGAADTSYRVATRGLIYSRIRLEKRKGKRAAEAVQLNGRTHMSLFRLAEWLLRQRTPGGGALGAWRG